MVTVCVNFGTQDMYSKQQTLVAAVLVFPTIGKAWFNREQAAAPLSLRQFLKNEYYLFHFKGI